ncbi:serine/threonine-protein kinase [Williamsia soli]|uniref:serine/threonine-protein kinase n=1 Tax=Williamsia soli TaxID=364929 RepID=UPI0027DB154F|nr:serine/threonine-protein kinase [Williamsia soli]
MILVPGTRVAGLTVRAHLGSGGTSEVYKVHNPVDDRIEALKVLDTEFTAVDVARMRFEREFEIARTLEHPHIVAMYRSGELAGAALGPQQVRSALWMTMQYVEGTTAAVLIPGPHGQPRLPLVLEVLAQIAEALDFAHRMDVLHRDVKPSNILIGHQTQISAVLTDFGIARFLDDTRPVAQNGRIVGSIPYAAPEMLQGQQLSTATDVYSLACAVVELLTGRPPFPYPTTFGIVHAHIAGVPPKVSDRRRWLPSAIDSILGKALAKDPAARYQSCSEFIDLIKNVVRDVPVPPDSPRPFGWSRLRTRGR